MGQPSDWRERAAYYWNLSKTVRDYDLSEQYAELAARYLDMAEKFDGQGMAGAAPDRQSSKPNSSAPRLVIKRGVHGM
jgi:hypothetical protein